MSAPRRLAAATAATLLGGGLQALAFPPFDVSACAWICLVPLLLALRTVGAGGALWLGFLWGQLLGITTANALPVAVSNYFSQPAWVGWGFAVFIWTATGSLYYMAFALAYRSLARRFTRALPLLAAAAWAAAELGRGRLFTPTHFFIGNPWGLLGYSQLDSPVIQLASLTGIYGVSFVVVAVNAALAQLALAAYRGRLGERRPWVTALVSLLPAVCAAVFGVVAVRTPEARAEPEQPVEVAIAQGRVHLGSAWRADSHGKNLDVYLALTRRAFREGAPAIVFWPEAALTFFLSDDDELRGLVTRVLHEGDAELVVGGPSRWDGTPPHYTNSVFLLSPRGEIRGRYDKEKLVPFSEYTPFGLDLAERDFGTLRSYRHGAPTPPLPTRAGPAGVLVCNESLLPEVAGDRVRAGASYLVNPSNDSWIANPQFAEIMFVMTAVRAVEQRRYVVRASTAGPSGVIDPWGRVRVRAETGKQALARGLVEGRSALSLYGRLGDAFAFACLLVALAAWAWAAWQRPAAGTGGAA